jgi:membrane-associated phospholipid phosphatase
MEDVITAYQEAFASPFNVFLLFLMFAMLIFWWSAHFWQTPERVRRRAKFFSPKPTQILQKYCRNNDSVRKILDFITPQIWLWGFILSILIEFHICALQAGEAWRYGIATLLSWGTSMTIQFIFPVIVPIRWNEFGKELPVIAIRLGNFKQSDHVNGLLYNGLPSNHLGMMLVGVILSLVSFSRNSWSGYLLLLVFFIGIALFFSFSVIYLGEHYIQDLIASILVFIPIMTLVLFILDFLFPLVT